ncbi:osmosensing histidine protein kinase Sln1p [[Candida] jaroonii]|uniref:Osmosensing histidine protein kinase Sln1p n=1 Tax=[Candida] jaroonii TaxID=467808 RepID=A0ACA9Y4V5_9ASCO|nr:osmosensing histidine protein kinase Sln1p [[Candida] jaroonii]
MFASLFSLLILAIVCGLYFSHNLSNLRAERLEVISQLKSSQVTQAIDYLFYQVYYLTTRDAITDSLTNYRAGNNSMAVFETAQASLDQFLTSSESFASARLYNLDLRVVAESSNNNTLVSSPAADYLYPLQQNLSIPEPINRLNNSLESFYFTGPVSNSSDPYSTYFIGITYPIFANTSIILSAPSIAGYLTVLTSADNIQVAVNTSQTFPDQDSQDYKVVAYSPVYNSSYTEDSTSDSLAVNELVGFQAVFPVLGSKYLQSNNVYNINESTAAKEALTHYYGSSTNKKSIDGETVAIGYSRVSSVHWSIVVEQKKSTFNGPSDRLKNIIIGVSIGIGVFMCLITFPLAVMFIRPITKLKDATEAITRSKREKDRGIPSPAYSPPPSYYSTLIRRMYPYEKKPYEKKKDDDVNDRLIELDDVPKKEMRLRSRDKRSSVLSSATGGSNSVYSTGIRLPSKITNQKSLFKDELAELTDAFNIMREELEKQYVHLEDRVKSRTKELEASKIEAEAANEAKTVFIANISHELRTPLNGILGMTSIAMEENEVGTIKDSLKLINRSGELLLHILTELLTYSKNTLNRSKLEKSSFQILEIVYQVQSIFNKLAVDQRVYFKILIRPNSFRKLILYGDSNRIIQVVMNLVSNALKFTPVEGRVDVTFKLLGEYDHERSQQDNYESVKVKHLENETFHDTSSHPYDRRPAKKPLDNDTDASINALNSKQENNLDNLNTTDDDIDSASDTTSLYTLSTQEYDKVIFQSQFTGSKPLPRVPESPESDDKSLPKTPRTSLVKSNVDKNNLDISDTESKFEDEERDKVQELQPQLLPPPNMRGTNTATTASSTKRPSITSMDSLNSNELVKNGKVYKIKNLYKPKTWAIQIQVSDTGPGIEPALQEKVFEPFIQGDQTLSRSYGGTGLGLAICRQLAKMMKGTMTLKSNLGVGSTFIFTVPLPQVGEILVSDDDMNDFAEDEFNPKSKANRKVAFAFDTDSSDDSNTHTESPELKVNGVKNKSSDESLNPTTSPFQKISNKKSDEEIRNRPAFIEKPHLVTRTSTGTANSSSGSDREKVDRLELPTNDLLGSLSHLKILVAEDNMVNQEVIKRMLSLEGFDNITMASNGAEAVDFVKTSIEMDELFDLIFMDVQMPKIDGLLATKMIRGNLNYERPIIALTAFADESNVKECLNSGMSGFLSKPIRRTNLRKIITEYAPKLLTDVTSPGSKNGEKRLGY